VRGRGVVAGCVLALVVAPLANAESVDIIDSAATVPPDAVARPVATRCPTWTMTFSEQRTAEPLIEVSGIVGSRIAPDMWWVHNDSGDIARAFLIDSALNIVTEIRLDGVFALDFEDIAIDGEGTVWLADIGDNLKFRPTVQLYGFPETTVSGIVSPRRVEITYPDRPHDVETLLLDPRTGDGFLVDKRIPNGVASVFRIPAAVLSSGGAVTVQPVATIDVSAGGPIGPTGGDISPDGSTIVIKTLTTAYLWPRVRNQTVVEALLASPQPPCVIPNAGENEAIGFDRDGRRLVAIAEGLGTRLRTLTRQI
jgi:hypothetical protein